MTKDYFTKLITGNTPNDMPLQDYGRVVFTSASALLVQGICIFYMLLDIIDQVGRPIWLYVACMLVAVIAFLANIKGKYTLGKIILLVTGNITTYLFAAWSPQEFGAFLFFIPVSIWGLTLFNYRERYRGLMFVILSVSLFALSHFFDYSLLSNTYTPPENPRLNFAINFLVSLFVSVVALAFLTWINHQSQEVLRSKQHHLIDMASELRTSKARFELAIKGSSAGIWDWNITDNHLYCSPTLEKMLGFEPRSLQGLAVESFFESVHHDDKPLIKSGLENHLENNEVYHLEFRLFTKNKGQLWVLKTGQAEWDRQGNPIRMVGTMVDISERKNNENKIQAQNEMLAKTNKELDRFVYSASHDLRAPLMSMLGLVGIASESEDKSELLKYIDMMKGRIETLDLFIQEIIDYSRNSRTEVAYSDVPLAAVVASTIDNLKYINELKQVHAVIDVPPDMTLKTDLARLKVILSNLVSNSIKYADLTKERPYVEVSVIEEKEEVSIVVKDNGIGVAQQNQSKVFDMFYRATDRSKGSGLGLYIVKETIDKLEGKISLVSTPGKGATFTVVLPKA